MDFYTEYLNETEIARQKFKDMRVLFLFVVGVRADSGDTEGRGGRGSPKSGSGRRPRRRITATGENMQKRPKIFGENGKIKFWTKQEFQIYDHASVNWNIDEKITARKAIIWEKTK